MIKEIIVNTILTEVNSDWEITNFLAGQKWESEQGERIFALHNFGWIYR